MGYRHPEYDRPSLTYHIPAWSVKRLKRWPGEFKYIQPNRFWFHHWLPSWHRGRGYYWSVGCGFFAVYRGY